MRWKSLLIWWSVTVVCVLLAVAAWFLKWKMDDVPAWLVLGAISFVVGFMVFEDTRREVRHHLDERDPQRVIDRHMKQMEAEQFEDTRTGRRPFR